MTSDQSQDFKKYDDLNFRFKSSMELNTKDGDENEQIVSSAVITDQKKE